MMQPFGGPQQGLGPYDLFNPQFNAMLNATQHSGGLGLQQGGPLGNNAMQQLGGQQQDLRQNRSPSHFSETSQDLRETDMIEDFLDRIAEEKGTPLSNSEEGDLMDAWLNSMRTPSPPVRPEADARLPSTPAPAPVKPEVVDNPPTAPAEPTGTNEWEPALATMNEAFGQLSSVESTSTPSPEANDAPQKSPI